MGNMIGRRIGSWILERELGRGGMATVFLARHAELGTPAAVKALTRIPGGEPNLQACFEREAEVHAGLRHPHVARVHDCLEEHGTWFLVIEYLSGGSLADHLEEGPPPPGQAVAWIRQALAGLGHAHGRRVVHRDVKPANLMLDEYGVLKVTDFGIARPPAGGQLTASGTTLGSVQYMSPEQLEGLDDVDPRSDLYATGAVLYELLAGEPPFAGESLSQVLRSRLVAPEPPPLDRRSPDVDPRLAAIVHRCLAVDREDRHRNAEALRRALQPFEAGAGGGGGAPTGGTMFRSVDETPVSVRPPPW